jgi:hypothetical protein
VEPVVIDYETFAKILDCHDHQVLTIGCSGADMLVPRPQSLWSINCCGRRASSSGR